MTKSAYPHDRVEALLKKIKLPPSYRILPTRHAKTPLGTAPADSRFCDRGSGFTVLYATPDFATAFIEVVVRDRFVRAKAREINVKEVTQRSTALISSKPQGKLSMLDLRKGGCTRMGAPTDAVNARNHSAGRALGRDIHNNHEAVDGLLFSSRLTDEDVFAIFDRAIHQLSADDAQPLADHPQLPEALDRHDIKLFVRT